MTFPKTILTVVILASLAGAAWWWLPADMVAQSLMAPSGGTETAMAPPELPHEIFEVLTVDGVRVKGWFFPAEPDAQGSVVICHGVGSSHMGALGLAQLFHSAGDLHVVVFDFRGHGESERVDYTYGARETNDVIVGEADRTIPADHGRRIHRALARSTLWSLPNIGHDDWWTHPDFGRRVVDFVHTPDTGATRRP